jgi:amidase
MAVRRRWAELFDSFDIVLAPTLGVAAFPHADDDGLSWAARTLKIDGRDTPFGDQLAWPGMAVLGHLPATAFPVGRTAGGLPIGLQAMGPYLEDYTTIAFAEAMERELAGEGRARMAGAAAIAPQTAVNSSAGASSFV